MKYLTPGVLYYFDPKFEAIQAEETIIALKTIIMFQNLYLCSRRSSLFEIYKYREIFVLIRSMLTSQHSPSWLFIHSHLVIHATTDKKQSAPCNESYYFAKYDQVRQSMLKCAKRDYPLRRLSSRE